MIWPNSTGNIRACTFCWKFVAQIETGDLKHNTKSIKELMKRLSLSTAICKKKTKLEFYLKYHNLVNLSSVFTQLH